MKKIFKVALVLTAVLFMSCEKENLQSNSDMPSVEQSKEFQTSSANKLGTNLAFGDVVTIYYYKTHRYFTSETNGDATFNKKWSTISPWLNNVWLPYAKFKLMNPNNITSTAEVKSGDEIAFKSISNNLYITAESWDDDVSVNRPNLGPWEKWKIYKSGNVNVGETFHYTPSVNDWTVISLKSTWNKYLKADANNFAKASGQFDPTVLVWSNDNTIVLSKID